MGLTPARGATESQPAAPHLMGRKPGPRSRNLMLLVVVLVAALFADFLSPQISLLGRGLRLALPLFVLLCGITLLVSSKASSRQLHVFVAPTILGLVFVGMGVLRNLIDPQPDLLQNHTTNAAVCIMIWIVVIMVRHVFPESLEGIRWICLGILGVSLGLGVPLLIQEPGIARLTMAESSLTTYHTSILYPKGIANYAWYTMVACAWPVMANWLYNSRQRFLIKLIGWCLLLAASAAVLFSTFAMAVFLLPAGALIWLIFVLIGSQSRASRFMVVGVLVVLLVALPSLYYLALNSQATAFSIDKVTNLFTGVFTEGFLEGDTTGRTTMFVDTTATALRNPIFGAWGVEPDFYISGHSSWADTAAAHGILGLSLWFGFLSPSWRKRGQPISVSEGAAAGTLSWILLGVGGILNPTFYSAIGLLLIWLFDEGGIWRRQRRI